MRRFAFFTIVLAIVLAACQPVAPVESGQEGIVVTDALGRETTFSELPQRVVVAGRGTYMVTGAVFMFEEAQSRLAAFEGGRFNDPANFIPLVDPSFDEKIILERNAGPEQIAPVNPDAIVLKTTAQDELGAALEALGVPIVYVEMESVEQYFDDVRTLGQLFGNPERAEEIIAYFQERLDRIYSALAEVDEKPSVLLIQYSTEGDTVAVEVPSADWLQTRQVELAGGEPVWKDAAPGGGWTTVNFEQVAQWNPDKIFVVTYQSDASEVVAELVESPEWQALDAVQNGEIYGFPEDIFGWDSPDPRWILGVTWMGTRIHPEAMADVDMLEEIRSFFEFIYGLDEETIEDSIIPTLTGDWR